jgi:hypothetical protein
MSEEHPGILIVIQVTLAVEDEPIHIGANGWNKEDEALQDESPSFVDTVEIMPVGYSVPLVKVWFQKINEILEV